MPCEFLIEIRAARNYLPRIKMRRYNNADSILTESAGNKKILLTFGFYRKFKNPGSIVLFLLTIRFTQRSRTYSDVSGIIEQCQYGDKDQNAYSHAKYQQPFFQFI